MGSANKTVETQADIAAYVVAIADPVQRADSEALIALMSRISGHPPRLWGSAIMGFGSYHYRYDSGREGDAPRIAFSPRKGKMVLYVMDGFPEHQALLDRLGRHKTGKACLYIKRLSDVDASVLELLCTESLKAMEARYPAG